MSIECLEVQRNILEKHTLYSESSPHPTESPQQNVKIPHDVSNVHEISLIHRKGKQSALMQSNISYEDVEIISNQGEHIINIWHTKPIHHRDKHSNIISSALHNTTHASRS